MALPMPSATSTRRRARAPNASRNAEATWISAPVKEVVDAEAADVDVEVRVAEEVQEGPLDRESQEHRRQDEDKGVQGVVLLVHPATSVK
jgi:hypothetical protein